MNQYPMLHFLVRWGQPIAVALAGLIAVAGIWAALSGGNALWGLGALLHFAASSVLY